MNHIIKGLGSYPYDFIQKTSYDSVTTGILIEKLSIVKKAQNTMLNVKLDNARTSPTQSNMHVKMAVFVDGVFSTSASDYMDFPTSYSSYTSWDKQKGISTLADGALVEVYLVVVWNTGTFTGTVSAYVKNIQMYLS